MNTVQKTSGIFTTREVSKLSNNTHRKVLYMVEKGLLKPTVEPVSKGSGYLFSWLQIIEAKAISRMRDLGVSLQKITKAMNYLEEWLEEKPTLSDKRIVINSQDLYFYDSEESAKNFKVMLLTGQIPGQTVMPEILNFEEFEKECYQSCVTNGLLEKLNKQIVKAS